MEERVWPVEPNGTPGGRFNLREQPRPRPVLPGGPAVGGPARRPVDPLWYDVYDWFDQSGRREECARVLAGLFFSNREGRSPSAWAGPSMAAHLKTSISALEKFRPVL